MKTVQNQKFQEFGVAGVPLLESVTEVKISKKKLNASDRRHIARKIAKSTKLIWIAANDAELCRLARMAENLFYEAYLTASGKVELDQLIN